MEIFHYWNTAGIKIQKCSVDSDRGQNQCKYPLSGTRKVNCNEKQATKFLSLTKTVTRRQISISNKVKE